MFKGIFPLAAVGLTALLSACGQSGLPLANAPLARVELGAGQGLRAQGFTGDAADAHYDVTVRDAQGNVVAFHGTTFDPTGTGTRTLTLSQTNGFHQTLLLPQGTYTFESRVKDDATGSVLLAYGPSQENVAMVDAMGSVVRVTSHAVLDPAGSSLTPVMNLAELYTNSTLDLGLNLKLPAVDVNGNPQVGTVPTSDIGPVTYSLGSVTDGVLNGAGSKVGVNVTARGTADDSELNVVANFRAWVYDSTTDTASFQPVTLAFAHAIQTNVLMADMVMPQLSLAPVSAAPGQASTLSGTLTDDVQAQALRVYVSGNLIASTDPEDQSGGAVPVMTDSSGMWSTTWVPEAEGDVRVDVIGEDSSGNETRITRTVTVQQQTDIQITPVTRSQGWSNYYESFNMSAGQSLTFKVNADTTDGGILHFKIYGDTTVTATDPSGNPLPVLSSFPGYTDFYGYASGQYTFVVTATADQQLSIETHYD